MQVCSNSDGTPAELEDVAELQQAQVQAQASLV